MAPEPGVHEMHVAYRDTAGTVRHMHMRFDAVEAGMDDYILIVDDYDKWESNPYWGLDSERDAFYDAIVAPFGNRYQWEPYEHQLGTEIAAARRTLPDVHYGSEDLATIAELTSTFEVDGHRADIVILKAAMANAAFAGRERVNELDILHAAELALPHRLKKQPLKDPDADVQNLQARIDEVRNRVQEQESESTSRGEPAEKKTMI